NGRAPTEAAGGPVAAEGEAPGARATLTPTPPPAAPTPAPPPAPANHCNPASEEMLEPGQEVLVQVVKEPLGQKGARITSHVSLPGRYLVFMPTVEHVGVSRKIMDDDERRRVKTMLKEIRQGRGGGGFIVRTAGFGRSREDFERDARYLTRT